jgi:hypothetical protein
MGSLSIGRPVTGSCSAGGAFSSVARECRVPDFVVLVLQAADENGHSRQARQSFVGRWVPRDPGVLHVAGRFSLRGGIADVALIVELGRVAVCGFGRRVLRVGLVEAHLSGWTSRLE